MQIEILATDRPNTRQFQRDGVQRSVTDQPAYLHFPNLPYPMPFKISLDSPASAYPPGFYQFSPDSVRTNNYGQLEFNRFGMTLIPIPTRSESTK